MTRTSPMLLVLLTALIDIPVAEAGPIIFFDTSRSLHVNGEAFQDNTNSGSWSAASSSSGPQRFQMGQHFSVIGLSRHDAQGHAEIFTRASGNISALSRNSTDGPVEISTEFFTSFQIDAPYFADLDGSTLARGESHTEGYLYDVSNQTMLAQVMVAGGVRQLDYEGVLGPGIYNLYLQSQISAPSGPYEAHATFGGDLTLQQFTPVPEPATMTLFGVGLAATAWRRRKR